MARKRKAVKAATIEAERFSLVDSEGKLRAALYTWPGNGDPQVELFAKDGCGRLRLAVADDMPSIAFLNAEGQPLISFGVSSDGSSICVCAPDGTLRFSVEVEGDDLAHVSVHGKSGKPKWTAPRT